MDTKSRLIKLFKQNNSFFRKMITSAFWLVAFRTASRILKFTSIIIIARILFPADFGLFGLPCLSLGIFQVFSSIGITTKLIQKKNNTEEFLNTVWTVRLIKDLFVFFSFYYFALRLSPGF